MREVDLRVPSAPVHEPLEWPVSIDSLADLTGVVAIIPAFNEERHVGSVVLRLDRKSVV